MELVAGTTNLVIVRQEKREECTGRARVTVRANKTATVYFRWYFKAKSITDPTVRGILAATHVHTVEPSGKGRVVEDSHTFPPNGDDLVVEFSTFSRPIATDPVETMGALCG